MWYPQNAPGVKKIRDYDAGSDLLFQFGLGQKWNKLGVLLTPSLFWKKNFKSNIPIRGQAWQSVKSFPNQVTPPHNPVDDVKLSKKDVSKLKRFSQLRQGAETKKTLEILTFHFGEKMKFFWSSKILPKKCTPKMPCHKKQMDQGSRRPLRKKLFTESVWAIPCFQTKNLVIYQSFWRL